MDILISSNLERLLYNITENNAEKVTEYMTSLNNEGNYKIDSEDLKKIQSQFFGAWVDELETKEAIGRIYNDYKYLMDTHTAVAWRTLEKYRLLTSDEMFSIILSTASPYKFSDSVLEALDDRSSVGKEPFALLHELNERTGVPIPVKMIELEKMTAIHNDVIAAADMKNTIKANLL